VLDPVAIGVRGVVAWSIADVRETLPEAEATVDESVYRLGGEDFKKLPSGQYVPLDVYRAVSVSPGAETAPVTPARIYDRYVEIKYLKPWLLYPVLASLFLFILYLVGRFLAVGLGRFLWSIVEFVIRRVPVVRNVYSSVKQVTDFMVSDNQYEFNRVIAVEYPAKGLWTVAFVTGEGLADVQAAAGEPTLAVLIPTNPMPVTGYTAIVKRSEVIDLDLTIDQACEFIISCGVVVPPHQLLEWQEKQNAERSGKLPDSSV